MAHDNGAATTANGMDMPAHEATYAQFIALTETIGTMVLCIVLLLVLWGLKGAGMLALVGLILTAVAGALGGMTGLGWKMVAPVFVLIGLACIVA